MLDTSNLSIGQIVLSKSGRDSGRPFVIVDIVDSLYVNIADGNLRKIENPKKKKVKHLQPTKLISETISDMITSNLEVSNALIKKEIQAKINLMDT